MVLGREPSKRTLELAVVPFYNCKFVFLRPRLNRLPLILNFSHQLRAPIYTIVSTEYNSV